MTKTRTPAQKAARRARNKRRRLAKKNRSNPMSKAATVSGHGAYSLKDIGSRLITPFVDDTSSSGTVNKLFRAGGGIIGDALGIPGASRALGNAASWFARKVLGSGDYTLPTRYSVKVNSLLAPGTKFHTNDVPSFSGDGTVTRITHQEYIQDITSSTTFNVTNWLINPGNPALFPWLSNIAVSFEEFEFKGLIFMFKSTSATAVGSTNTGLGSLIMATEYDVVDPNYATKVEMETSDFAVSGVPCSNYLHPVECDMKQNVLGRMFVNTATTTAGYPDDPRFSALGNFQLATVGMQSASNIGELWVAYDVELRKPQIVAGASNVNATAHYAMTYNATTSSCTNTPMSILPATGIAMTVTTNVTISGPTVSVVNNGAPRRFAFLTNWVSAVNLAAGGYATIPSDSVAGGASFPTFFSDSAGAHVEPARIVTAGFGNFNSYPHTAGACSQIAIVDMPNNSTWTLIFPDGQVGGVSQSHAGDLVIIQMNSSLTKPMSEKKRSEMDIALEEIREKMARYDALFQDSTILVTQTPGSQSSSSSSSVICPPPLLTAASKRK